MPDFRECQHELGRWIPGGKGGCGGGPELVSVRSGRPAERLPA